MTIIECVTVSPELFSIIVLYGLGSSGFVLRKVLSNLINKDRFCDAWS